jgi:ABC-2 type transport system ATP-binding protein
MQATMRTFVKAYNERFGATVLLTSHYMDDVVALCPRVIVIDRGRLIYDGALDELIHKVRPEKRISLRFGKPVERIDIERFGNVVAHAGAQATLQVEQANLQPAVSGLLAALPVVDLTVEDPPLEEVMRELFQAQPGRVETKS